MQSWADLARDLAADPVTRNRVMLDILNEPDSRGIKWDAGPGAGGYGMTALYEMAMDAIYKVNPTALMLVEGTGQLGKVAMNWGDGFATDPAIVQAGGVQSAAPFFTKMMRKPYLNNIVISPHLYPPSVSTQTDPAAVTGAGLAKRLTDSFGYLTKQGFCASGVCKTFPVVFGETGSKFTEPLDLRMLSDFAAYMQTDDSTHAKMPNMIFWCWNANSGDTGGFVTDNWKDVWRRRARRGLEGGATCSCPRPHARHHPLSTAHVEQTRLDGQGGQPGAVVRVSVGRGAPPADARRVADAGADPGADPAAARDDDASGDDDASADGDAPADERADAATDGRAAAAASLPHPRPPAPRPRRLHGQGDHADVAIVVHDVVGDGQRQRLRPFPRRPVLHLPLLDGLHRDDVRLELVPGQDADEGVDHGARQGGVAKHGGRAGAGRVDRFGSFVRLAAARGIAGGHAVRGAVRVMVETSGWEFGEGVVVSAGRGGVSGAARAPRGPLPAAARPGLGRGVGSGRQKVKGGMLSGGGGCERPTARGGSRPARAGGPIHTPSMRLSHLALLLLAIAGAAAQAPEPAAAVDVAEQAPAEPAATPPAQKGPKPAPAAAPAPAPAAEEKKTAADVVNKTKNAVRDGRRGGAGVGSRAGARARAPIGCRRLPGSTVARAGPRPVRDAPQPPPFAPPQAVVAVDKTKAFANDALNKTKEATDAVKKWFEDPATVQENRILAARPPAAVAKKYEDEAKKADAAAKAAPGSSATVGGGAIAYSGKGSAGADGAPRAVAADVASAADLRLLLADGGDLQPAADAILAAAAANETAGFSKAVADMLVVTDPAPPASALGAAVGLAAREAADAVYTPAGGVRTVKPSASLAADAFVVGLQEAVRPCAADVKSSSGADASTPSRAWAEAAAKACCPYAVAAIRGAQAGVEGGSQEAKRAVYSAISRSVTLGGEGSFALARCTPPNAKE